MTKPHVNRRTFISGVAAGGVLTAIGPVATNAQTDKIRWALIGCGGMGNAHIDAVRSLISEGYPAEIAAVCDVYSVRASDAAAKAGCPAIDDYRKILDDKSIQAVSIATPDHWHARMIIEAAQAGKDIYCEKPLTHWRDIAGIKKVAAAVKDNRRVLQVGTQGMSDSIWTDINKAIKAGEIGQLVHAQASDMRNGDLGVYNPSSHDGRAEPDKNLNWKAWLGPAPAHKWEPGRFFAFRSFWDYSGGVGTDFFPHILTPLVKSMGLGFPARVTAMGGQYAWKEGRQVPDIYNLLIEYSQGPIVQLNGAIASGVNNPMIIRGFKGAVFPHEGEGAVIKPERSVNRDGQERSIKRTQGQSLKEHIRDFFDCTVSRKNPSSDIDLGHRVMVALAMGIHSYRTGKTIELDPRWGA